MSDHPPAVGTPTDRQIKDALLKLVMAWDFDDSLEFLQALRRARKLLGLKLAGRDDVEDIAVLKANGYDVD